MQEDASVSFVCVVSRRIKKKLSQKQTNLSHCPDSYRDIEMHTNLFTNQCRISAMLNMTLIGLLRQPIYDCS